MGMKRKSWLQPTEAARYLSVPCSTIRKWITEGRLRAAKLPTGHLRILARDVARFLIEQGKAIPTELGDLAKKQVLIVDPDKKAARSVAEALQAWSGCKVTVAESGSDARGLLNGFRPDLVVLGVRGSPVGAAGNGVPEMLILAGATDEPLPKGTPLEAAFRVDDIIPGPADARAVVSQVANVLLG